MAKDSTKAPVTTAALPSETPPMPSTPLLPPVPQMLTASTLKVESVKKREIVDAFKPVSRSERDLRQAAKQTRESAAAFLTGARELETQLTSILRRGTDANAAESFAKEGLTMDAVQRLNDALEKLLNEFMPTSNN